MRGVVDFFKVLGLGLVGAALIGLYAMWPIMVWGEHWWTFTYLGVALLSIIVLATWREEE